MEARSSDPVLLLGVPDVWGDEVLENTGFSLKKYRNFVNIPPPYHLVQKSLCKGAGTGAIGTVAAARCKKPLV